MKKVIFCFLAFLFFSGSAFATNWVHVTTNTMLGITAKYYIDSDSVTRNKDTITYWRLTVNDKPEPAMKTKRILDKVEARTNEPRGTRILESHWYSEKGEIVLEYPESEQTRNGRFSSILVKGSPEDMTVGIALKYAKDGKSTGKMPPLP